uniref:Uncharacterized protein n=1 Tax=Magnetococcus massalia (strain MO-1) TaxID=451514 RepID=A0A1S7LGC4_MAGMO|nr:protein of unknown function [Candidatus Magnetococcus massalia]CRH06002.1 protein of unknown function [Candidatus Magnetococcus massalia]
MAEKHLGMEVLTSVLYKGYLTRLLENQEVHDYLAHHQPDIFREFKTITESPAHGTQP